MGEKLPYRYQVEPDYDRYEYRETEGQRKCWDGEPDLSEEGWEEWAEWERFDYTEQRYWRRPLNEAQLAAMQKANRRAAAHKRVQEATAAVVKTGLRALGVLRMSLHPDVAHKDLTAHVLALNELECATEAAEKGDRD